MYHVVSKVPLGFNSPSPLCYVKGPLTQLQKMKALTLSPSPCYMYVWGSFTQVKKIC